MSAPAAEEPRGLGGFARVAVALLGVAAVLDLVAVGSGVSEYSLLGRAGSGGLTGDRAEANDTRQQVIAIAQLALSLATLVAFVAWLYRAYRNLIALGAGGMRYRPYWAILGWIVPVVSLVIPKQIVDDVWRASEPGVPIAAGEWRSSRRPALHYLWWAAFLISNLLGRLAPTDDDATVDQLRTGTALLVAEDAVSLVAAALAILVVVRTTRRQEAGRAAIDAVGAPPADGLDVVRVNSRPPP